MKSKLPVKFNVDADVLKGGKIGAALPIGTWWEFEHVRAGKVIDAWEQKNVTTTEGRNRLLNVMFNSAAQITTWYVCIFSNDYVSLVGDTYAVPGYTEVTATIDEATRPAFTVVDATASVVTNTASKATFTANASFVAYGAALVGGTAANTQTKGDKATAGSVLFAAAKFPTAKPLVDDDILVVSCTLTLTDV